MDGRTPPDGGPIAFADFVAARYHRLVGTAYLLTRDQGLAEDLVQTALVKCWPKWRRIESDPEAYVRRVLMNTYATWWRRRWRHEHATDRLPETPVRVGNPHDSAADRTDLWRALGELPPKQRAVVVLRFYEDQSEAQTADILGCSVGTVKSHTARALSRLRQNAALSAERDPKLGRPTS